MCLVCRQGDNVWIDPSTNGEFDVAIGARVKAVDGENICLVDDDNKVACRLFYCYIDDFNLITNIWLYTPCSVQIKVDEIGHRSSVRAISCHVTRQRWNAVLARKLSAAAPVIAHLSKTYND